MRILNKIKSLFKRKQKFELTAKGNYLVYYLIKKYLNIEEVENIENYENAVEACLKDLNQINAFEAMNIEFDINAQRTFSAILVINMILHAVIPTEKEKILSYINSQENRDLILNIQNNNTFIKFVEGSL